MNKKDLVQAFINNQKGRNHNAESYEINNKMCFRLYSTDIAVIEDGKLYLSTGGWETVTTKSYMNMILEELGSRYAVHQMKGEWFWRDLTGQIFKFNGGGTIDLASGYIISLITN